VKLEGASGGGARACHAAFRQDLDVHELAPGLPGPGHGLHIQRCGRQRVVRVVAFGRHADGEAQVAVVACGCYAAQAVVDFRRLDIAFARAVGQIDEGDALRLRAVGFELQRHGLALRVDQLDRAHIEA
jgi:hypothetical protein